MKTFSLKKVLVWHIQFTYYLLQHNTLVKTVFWIDRDKPSETETIIYLI